MQKHASSIIIGLLLVIIGILLYNNFQQKSSVPANADVVRQKEVTRASSKPAPAPADNAVSIDELTKESVVVPYVKQHGALPDYYITKRDARRYGWKPAEGNLCDVLPGRAIGGDVFTNREKRLPTKHGRIWYEADLNYSCEHRNADRLLFSNDGLIFTTYDHYKTFEEK